MKTTYCLVLYFDQEKVIIRREQSRAAAFRSFNHMHYNIPVGIETEEGQQVAWKEKEF